MTAFLKTLGQWFAGSPNYKKETAPEISEFEAVADRLVERIEEKIKALKGLEARADEKIVLLDGLITRVKGLNLTAESVKKASGNSRDEVQSLSGKGFKADQIARILDLPSGEVELILNLAPAGQ
jgi:hypothetical protein